MQKSKKIDAGLGQLIEAIQDIVSEVKSTQLLISDLIEKVDSMFDDVQSQLDSLQSECSQIDSKFSEKFERISDAMKGIDNG